MPIFILNLICSGLLFLTISPGALAASDNQFTDKLINLGTALEGGLFYPLGKELCANINDSMNKSDIRCVAWPTGGVDYNLQAVANGQLQAAFAYSATTKEPYPKNIVKVANLYNAPISIIVKAHLGIIDPSNLRGRKINIGEKSSPIRALSNVILENAHIQVDEILPTVPMEIPAATEAFCKNEVDVVIGGISIPNKFYKRMAMECNGVMLSLSDEFINSARSSVSKLERQEYDLNSIGLGTNIHYQTVGQKVILVTNSDLDTESIRRFSSLSLVALKKLSLKEPLLQGWTEEYALSKIEKIQSVPRFKEPYGGL